jgi:5-methyltetrahydrofolate--homocysteine methyltransferase
MTVELTGQISESLQRGEDGEVKKLTREAIAEGIATKKILDDGLIAGMAVVGDRFKAHEIFLPEVLLAARAMYAGMDELKPLLIRDGVPSLGKVVIGSVQGDLHDIGKNLVGIMLKGAGFEVIDLGNDVSPERFVQTAREQGAPVIGMSALLTTTMPVMKKVVDLVKAEAPGGIKVIVGGAPVSAEFAREIGADAYGYDAASAVDRVKGLLASIGT